MARLVIRVYQIGISPMKNALLGVSVTCRFQPTCSTYAMEAMDRHGFICGGVMAARRLCRCHPWGGYGADPVPERC
jgi:hypothetical protein